MKSENEDISYSLITEENIIEATDLELTIFPEICAYLSYKNSLENDNDYYIVYYKDEICGITGLYSDSRLKEPDTIWMGWYGILPKFRKRGLGKQILTDTIAEARYRGYKTLRLYTSVTLCEDAQPLYDKVLDLGEDYLLEERELRRRVYSKSLSDDKVTPWGDRNLFLDENRREEDEALKIFNNLKNGGAR